MNAMNNLRKLVVAASLVAISGVLPARAQTEDPTSIINPNPPVRRVDANGVDLVSTTLSLDIPLLNYGDPKRPISVNLQPNFPKVWDSVYVGSYLNCTSNCAGPNLTDSLSILPMIGGSVTYRGNYYWIKSPMGNAGILPSPYFQNNATAAAEWTYGNTIGAIEKNSGVTTYYNASGDRLDFSVASSAQMITFADGETWTYYYNVSPIQYRLKYVVSSKGYGLQFTYNWNPTNFPTAAGDLAKWLSLSRITFYNKAFVYCDESALADCSSVSSLNTAASFSNSFSDGTLLVTPAGGSTKKISIIVGNPNGDTKYADLVSYTDLGVPGSTRTYSYDHIVPPQRYYSEINALSTLSDGVGTWHYEHPSGPIDEGPAPLGTTVTTPESAFYGAVGGGYSNEMVSYGEQLSGSGPTAPGRNWLFDLDNWDRLRGVTNPDLDQITYIRDSRGNVTSETRIPKPGSGLSNLTTRQASFPATCASYLTCNKPIWTKDAKGSQTDYTYNLNNGAVATVTGPANANGVRPQTRYSYVQRYAWILNSTGGYVHASAPIWVLDGESSCRASAATGNPSSPCAGNDEVRTSYDYGPDSGPNNLFLRGVVVTADGVSRRTCYTSDPQGNRISQTAPRAGLTVCP